MNSRERVNRALEFQKPDRVPRDLWVSGGTVLLRPGEVRTVLEKYPADIVLPVDPVGPAVTAVSDIVGGSFGEAKRLFQYGSGERARGNPYRRGTYTDEYGCTWQVAEEGLKGVVTESPLSDWGQLETYRPPWEVLERANWDDVNRICLETDKFVLTPWHIKPFERMQFLRGTEALFMDLAWGCAEVIHLRDMIHEFFQKEIELWCQTDVDGIRFADDWGSQTAPLISPQMWREVFKPLYADYCQMIHSAGKFAFMHSDGNITAIMADLIEIGVDALNAQLFCMDIEALGSQYRGQITFWGEIDRQQVIPFGQPKDVREAVRRVRRALETEAGGVIAQLEWGKNDPRQSIEAAFEAWLE